MGRRQEISTDQQCERLFPMIAEVLKENGISYNDIGKLVISAGPGSWTGIRVGVSAAYGIQLVTNAPIVTLSSMTVLAWKVAANLLTRVEVEKDVATCHYAVTVPMSRRQYYYQEYKLMRDTKIEDAAVNLAASMRIELSEASKGWRLFPVTEVLICEQSEHKPRLPIYSNSALLTANADHWYTARSDAETMLQLITALENEESNTIARMYSAGESCIELSYLAAPSIGTSKRESRQ